MNARKLAGFTLVELLVVMAVVAVLIGIVVPAVGPMVRGNGITRALDIVEGQLALARQTAITSNRAVEVRFYQYTDTTSSTNASSFHALQTLVVTKANVFTAVSKVVSLPTQTIIDSGANLSSLLIPGKRAKVAGTTALPQVGTSYFYIALRFKPDGSTDLQPTDGPWFLTVHDAIKGDALTSPPANFGTIEVDPVNGTLKLYRP